MIVERYDSWMASADWSNDQGASFRYDKTIEANEQAEHPNYPSVFQHLGGPTTKMKQNRFCRSCALLERK